MCLFLSVSLLAQDRYWFGQVNEYWNVAGNWSSTPSTFTATTVPGASHSVVIGADATTNCKLDVDVSVASLEVNGAVLFDLAGLNLTVAQNFDLNAGEVLCASGKVTVGGDVYLNGDTFESTSDTFLIGGNLTDPADIFTHHNGTVHFTDSATIDVGRGFYNLFIDSGTAIEQELRVNNTLHLNGNLMSEGYLVTILNNDSSALSGNGGLYFPLSGNGLGSLEWIIGESEHQTYHFPFIARSGEGIAGVDVYIDDAGTGASGILACGTAGLDNSKPIEVFPGCRMANAEGTSNTDYNLNRYWFVSPDDFTDAPQVTVTIHYNDADLAGLSIDESRLKVQHWGFYSNKWSELKGTLDTANNQITFSAPLDDVLACVLVDSTSPNYTTYNEKTGLSCIQAVDLDGMDASTVYEMADSVMWFKFTATDTFMHIYAASQENVLEQLTVIRSGCGGFITIGDTSLVDSSDYLILNEDTLITDSVYWIRVERIDTNAVVLTGVVVSEPLGAPSAPSPQVLCSDTSITFSIESVSAGENGDQIEWSLFNEFNVSDTLDAPLDIYHTVPAGLTDTLWIRTKYSKIPPISSSAAQTYLKVNYRPNNPDPVQFVSELSDTAVDFTFDSIFAGGTGTHIEWAFDTGYTTSDTALSPATISFQTAPGTVTAFWYRSVDSLSGCYSESSSGVAIVDTVPEYQPDTDTVLVVCHGGDWTYCIDNSDTNTYYLLLNDTIPLDTLWGNNSTICLNTGTIDSVVFLSVEYTDTTTEETLTIDTLLTVLAVGANDTVEFVSFDTLLFASDTFWYEAMSNHGAQIHYSIVSGGAVVDSATGRVDSVTANFVIRATTIGNPCDTVFVDLSVTVTDIAPPVSPEPQVIFIDSTDTITVVFDSIFPGSGGNQIEWSEAEDFSSSTIVYGMTSINVPVPVESEKNIWIRTRHNETGKVSRKVFTTAKILRNILSAGLLDKSRWKLSDGEFNSNDVHYTELGYQNRIPGNNPSFTENFALNYLDDWNATNPGNPQYCSNHFSFHHDYGPREAFNYGNLDGNASVDGIGEEVIFSNGMATFTATRLAQEDSINCPQWPSSSYYKYQYSTGMIICKNSINHGVPGMLEIRCKLPNLGEVWPAFWTIPGPNGIELDIFDNSSGPNKILTNFHDRINDILTNSCSADVDVKTSCNLAEDWHTINFLWSETEMIAFLDGKQYWSFNRQIPGKDDFPTDVGSVWNTFLISLQTPSYCSATTYKMYVDHIRYYQPSGFYCDKAKASMHGVICTPLTYETLPSSPFNHLPLRIGKSASPKGGNRKMSVLGTGNNAKIFYQGATDASDLYKLEKTSGIWTYEKINYRLSSNYNLWPFKVRSEVTPVNENLIYCFADLYNNSVFGVLKKIQGKFYTSEMLTVATPGIPHVARLDKHGKVFFVTNDNNLQSYNPNSNTFVKITTDGSVAGGVEVHSCGCIILYKDNNDNIRQLYWNGSWQSLPTPVVSGSMATIETAIDEVNNRYFFIGTDNNIYYYNFNYNTVNNTGAIRLGNRSKENINNGSLCSSTANAGRELVVSPDGNMVFYQALDLERWYFFNDKENSLVSNENWYQSPLRKGKEVLGPMAFEQVPFGNMYYFDSDHYLTFVQSDYADNPIVDCYEDAHTNTVAYKNHETNIDTPNTTTQVSENQVRKEQVEVSLYPNPSENAFTFEVSGITGQVIQLQITNLTGETLYSSNDWAKDGETFKLRWNSGNLASGYYIYHITTNKGEHSSGKLIKL